MTAVTALSSRRAAADVVRQRDLSGIVEELGPALARLSGTTLLITGGAGFLGYYLTGVPLVWNDAHPGQAPIRVMVFDNYFRGVPAWLGELEARRDVELVAHDVRGPLPGGLDEVAWVVHAAGIASPTYYRAHPIETMDANITGLRNLLELARARSDRGRALSGMLFYSSSEIYGDPGPDAIPTPETYRGNVSCTGPRACYDESKRYGETLCVNFARQHGVPVSMVRPFNNYGPGMKITDGRVVADFCRKALAGEDLVMLSDGSPTRTFCYVSDAVTGYYLTLLRGRPGEPYNIGVDGPEISMAALAGSVAAAAADVLGHRVSVIRESSSEADYLADNPTRRCPDITKAIEELGYHPKVALTEGLTRTLTWYAGHPEGTQD